MATRDEIYQAIRNADKAGDSESVRKLSAYLGSMDPAGEQKQPVAASATDAPNAVGTGFWRGVTGLAGLPVDTVTNVIDLGKAAIGAPYIAITGKSVPSWLEPADRVNVIGSSKNLMNAVRKVPGGSLMIDPQNPEYEGGYLQNAGAALTAINRPNSWAQLANQFITSQLGAAAGKGVGDATGNQALAITAGMLPTAVQTAATEGVKRSVRGGEEGRKRMEQRIQDLRNSGVENPTLGLASGNQLIGGVENLLQSTPGAVTIMKNSREAAIQGMEDAAQRAAANASGNRGAIESGRSIQKSANDFKQSFKDQQRELYDRLDQFVGKQTPVSVGNTRETLADLNSDIPGAPQISKQFKNKRIGDIERAILSDIGVTPSGSGQSIQAPVYGRGPTPVGMDMEGTPIYRGAQVGTSVQPGAVVVDQRPGPTRPDMMGNQVPIRGTSGEEVQIQIPGQSVPVYGGVPMRTDSFGRQVPVSPVIGSRTTYIPPANTSTFSGVGVQSDPRNTLPFDAVKKTRTLVGNELADNALLSDVPKSKWNPLYGALSRDMEAAAQAAGPQAQNAFARANDYTRAGLGRLERIAPIVDRAAPEQTFNALQQTLKENVSTFQAVKKTLPQDARGDFAGTIIERLGKATPGQQDATGSRWSPDRFLTNWNKISPAGQKELLSGIPNAEKVKDLVDSVANAASMMRDNSKLWANPSGTAANTAARGVLGLVGAGGAGALAGFVNPAVPLGAAATLGGVNLLARGATSKSVRDAMTRRTDIDPELINALATQLQTTQLQKPEKK